MKIFALAFTLLSVLTLVSGHARLRKPKPLGYGTTPQLDGNAYNDPLKPDGSDFPCKGLIGVADMTPQAQWTAGGMGMFEIWPNEGNGGEGNLAAHSGGSCQISLSYDNGKSFKVLKSYEGGCPRDVPLNSNLAGPNQTFTFEIPKEAKSGTAVAAWTWIARTGNRGEFYMNCASVKIQGSGTSTLDNLPDMFVGDLIKGDIKDGMCTSTQEFYLSYPSPGDNVIKTSEVGKFKGPNGPGSDGTYNICKAPGGPSKAPGGPSTPTTPTNAPTKTPTNAPTKTPTNAPTNTQTNAPTNTQTNTPTQTATYPPSTISSPSDAPYPTVTGMPLELFEMTAQGYTYECRIKA
ncbi:hypothetical protein L211DRAFT_229428 [Terfezia boudieri ATCC MYA-4762]|uniref:Lytic polysaccharide monooxygenase n=1 Tax=Terfezia boudieri ATCC MYA-4762 TaxID=1051890 RepID=A0A3N4M0Q1_9PEZI|nr:hypothetical protein L211DRAFT_229428 [Terfezia boudieri ATCC MYA-4762]